MAVYIRYNYRTNTFVGESNAPAPHSLSCIVTESINFGNPDHVRKFKTALEARAKSGHNIGKASERQTAPLNNGVVLQSSVPESGATSSSGGEPCEMPIHIAVRKRLERTQCVQPLDQAPPVGESCAPRFPSEQKFRGKTNGYVMFLRHVNRKMGGDPRMGVAELIYHYDYDWKALSNVEKVEWRNKCRQI